MTRLYLITGFLGAGKTTFLQNFVTLFPDQKIALVINEFGRKGVDGTLLRHLGIAMSEIDNGSIFCSCRIEQFEQAVTEILANHKPDLIFVEASGLADPTAVRSIFSQSMFEGMEYAGAICLVDGVRFHKVYQTARVSRMQLAISDLVLINKTDLALREQIDAIRAIVLGQKPNRPVFETAFGRFDPAWLACLDCKAEDCSADEIHTRDLTLRSLALAMSGFDRDSLTAFLRMIAEDTYRIKGFVRLPEGIYIVDCVGPLIEIRPFSGTATDLDTLTILYGHGLPARKSINKAIPCFPHCTVEVRQIR